MLFSLRYQHEQQNTVKRRLAFTLIEVMIAITLTASIMTVAYTFMFFSNRTFSRGMDKIDIQKKIRSAMNKMASDLRSAKEIIKVDKDCLEFKKFIDDREERRHINLSGDTMSRLVKYELKKKSEDGADVIVMTVDNQEYRLMKFDSIGEDLFEAYTYNNDDALILFDGRINDSIQRSKISLVKVNFKIKQGNTEVILNTSINPRYLFGFKQQPYWNYNK
jgi:prepilin-type N-terminal cleavage/methylation domain-containing protein